MNKKICLLLLSLSIISIPFCTNTQAASPANTNTSISSSAISPCADKTCWKYKVVNGVL